MWLYFVIAIPFLFLIGIIYNSIKEQKIFEERYVKPLVDKMNEQKQQKANLAQTQDKFTQIQDSNTSAHAANYFNLRNQLDDLKQEQKEKSLSKQAEERKVK